MTEAPASSAAERRALLRSARLNILTAGAATVAAVVVTGRELALSPLYPLVALALFAVAALLLHAGLPHHPHRSFGPANQVTLLRAVLVCVLAGLVGQSAGSRVPAAATVIATVAALSDAFDGWLARRNGLSSSYGARFDMETDAALILVLSLLVWQSGKAGAWVCIAGLMRYAFAGAGWLIGWLREPLPQRRRRQAIAVLQTTGLIVALAPFVPVQASRAVATFGVVTLTLSFAIDIVWLRRQVRA